MNYDIGINLGWNDEIDAILQCEFWFKKCKEQGITITRIFLVEWGIGTLQQNETISKLNKVLKIAEQYNIKVILVIEHYVHFCKKTFRDFINSEYNFFTYAPKYVSSLKEFFSKQQIIELYEKQVSDFIDKIENSSTLFGIEICNEIDQVDINLKKASKWLDYLLLKLKSKYKDRFILSFSISNPKFYKKFKKLSNFCSLHTYGFPYETMIKNMSYFYSLDKNVLITEYSKFSDQPNTKLKSSATYFVSGLWGAFLMGKTYSPFSWWWNDILSFDEYSSIFKYFGDLKNKFSDFAICQKTDNVSVKILKNSKEYSIEKQLEKKKIGYRLDTLLKNPTFLFKEISAIKKFLKKKLMKKYSIPFAFVFLKCKKREVYLFETYCNSEVSIKCSNAKIAKVYDLVNCSERIINVCDKFKILINGCQLIEITYGE
jgi:hypothetical protein